MPLRKPIPVIAKSGIIASLGKLSKLTVIIPIMAEAIIKANPVRRLFNTIANFLST